MQEQNLNEIAGKPTFRLIDGLSIRFVESEQRSADALLLSPWPESVLAYEPTWSRLAERTHLVAIDLPGFGRSEGRDAVMLLAPWANSLFASPTLSDSRSRTSSPQISAHRQRYLPPPGMRNGSSASLSAAAVPHFR